MTTGRINQVTIFERVARRGEAIGARHETRPTRNPGGAFFDRNPTVRRAMRPAAVFVMAPPRARRVLGTLRARGRRRLLSRLVCASSSRAGPAIRKGRPPEEGN